MKFFNSNRKFRRDYDRLFRKDPAAANVMLLPDEPVAVPILDRGHGESCRYPSLDCGGESMNEITVLIELDARTWMPSAIFYNGATDTETAKLRGIAELMLKALHGREAAPLEEPEP